jgi:hypothetical protein
VVRHWESCMIEAVDSHDPDVRLRSVAWKQVPDRGLKKALQRDGGSINSGLVDNDARGLDAFQTLHVYIYIHLFSYDIDFSTSELQQGARQSPACSAFLHFRPTGTNSAAFSYAFAISLLPARLFNSSTTKPIIPTSRKPSIVQTQTDRIQARPQRSVQIYPITERRNRCLINQHRCGPDRIALGTSKEHSVLADTYVHRVSRRY